MGVPKPEYESIIIRPEDVKPSSNDMKVFGVCNPGGTIFQDKKTYLLLRVVERTNEEYEGHIACPRALVDKENYEVRWEWERLEKDAQQSGEGALVKIELEERIRPIYISHFRLAESSDGIKFKISEKPTFFPQRKYEEFGVEDARITKLEELVGFDRKGYDFLMSYVACSEEYDVCTAFALTNDFKNFKRIPDNGNIIFSAPSKDVVLFPRKILNPRTQREEFLALTRPMGLSRYMVPSIFLSYSQDLIQWGDHKLFVKGDEKGHVGAGPAPIECEDGWLIIDHQHRHLLDGSKEYIGRAYLVDKKDPSKMLRKSEEILEPHLKVSKPIVSNVTFPSAAVIKNNEIYIYTGEGDSEVGLHVYNLSKFMDFLVPV
ncbi:MAG: hypothetical protein Q8N63_07730 [Nanoarchaeota archaeon]|nr:hypothetical protein [Nanoarchaeota archaeon]